jgi:hypothetical protein
VPPEKGKFKSHGIPKEKNYCIIAKKNTIERQQQRRRTEEEKKNVYPICTCGWDNRRKEKKKSCIHRKTMKVSQ